MSLLEIRFLAMGCQMMAAIDAATPWEDTLLAQVPAWFETWEQHLSRFRNDSELSQLNTSPGRAIRVSPVLWAVFQAAVQAEQRSRGWVTPTIYDALIESGYVHSFKSGFSPHVSTAQLAEQRAPRTVPSLRRVQVDTEKQTLTLPPGLHLDFGGVAKGWAAHQALQRLQIIGPALVDAGGDIAVGDRMGDGQPWPIGINEPISDREGQELLMLSNCGVATVGRDYRRWQQQNSWQHHLIDPHTGRSAETDVMTATVVAPTVMEAEMAAKVVLLSGHQRGISWLNDQPGCEGVAVLEDGRQIYSRHFTNFLWREG